MDTFGGLNIVFVRAVNHVNRSARAFARARVIARAKRKGLVCVQDQKHVNILMSS